MKALQQAPGAWDRAATYQELCQIFDLLDGIPIARDLERSASVSVSMTLAGSDGCVAPLDLRFDGSEEHPAEDRVDSSLESLAELLADHNKLSD
jgi:hypothetical protein